MKCLQEYIQTTVIARIHQAHSKEKAEKSDVLDILLKDETKGLEMIDIIITKMHQSLRLATVEQQRVYISCLYSMLKWQACSVLMPKK